MRYAALNSARTELEAQKEETELEWISKSEEYENEFGQDE